MPSLRIYLGRDEATRALRDLGNGEVIELANDAEIHVIAMPGAMSSGAPAVMFAFKLPDGKVVEASTSFRLFASAFHALAGTFGTAYPDMQEMDILHQQDGKLTRTQMLEPSAEQFAECQVCGERETFPPATEGVGPDVLYRWLYKHFREKHPGTDPPVHPPPGADWD